MKSEFIYRRCSNTVILIKTERNKVKFVVFRLLLWRSFLTVKRQHKSLYKYNLNFEAVKLRIRQADVYNIH